MRHVLVVVLLCSCSSSGPPAPGGPRVAIEVAALDLPGLANACFDIAVTNEAGLPVWSEVGVCSGRYGNAAGGDIVYIGPCDATDTDSDGDADNVVTLRIAGLYQPDGPDADTDLDAIDDFVDPCAAPHAPAGCQQRVDCHANADARVTYDLTVMRRAQQGFFDVAVDFDDIFCSAKVDCVDDDGDPLRLVFDPVTGERVPSLVWAFACTDGDPPGAGGDLATSTHLYQDVVALVCGGTRYPIDPSFGPGNVWPGGVGAPAPLVQAMVFEGVELVQSGPASADKLYWNVALGLRASWFASQPVGSTCVLEASATASRGPLSGGATPAGGVYPFIDVAVTVSQGPNVVCTRHPLDGEPPNDGVGTRYTTTPPGGGAIPQERFEVVGRRKPGGDIETVPVPEDAVDECALGLDDCHTNALCADLPVGFSCTCGAGFMGDGRACADVDECLAGTDTCHEDATCTNTNGGFTCACRTGYAGDGVSCVDIDECLDGDTCPDDEICTNWSGSYDCTPCPFGYEVEGNACVNIDECAQGTHGCDPEDGLCTDTEGAWTCACKAGYEGDGTSCADIDECQLEPDTCGPDELCTNLPGTYSCDACPDGFEVVGGACVDIDECASGDHGCHADATCTNSIGGWSCACKGGYEGDGVSCVDVDECLEGTDVCADDELCRNTVGSHDCTPCLFGYEVEGNTCVNIDECAQGTHGCDPEDGLCTDTEGAWTCACKAGHEGDGRSCADIDECQLEPDTCGPDELCTNLPGTFSCDACPDGFEVDGGACVDIDECASGDHGCHADATCTNSIGGWSCACKGGYAGDGQSCADIDECLEGTDVCADDELCTNTVGSHDCTPCLFGYEVEGNACVNIDECARGTHGCDPEDGLCTDTEGAWTCACKAGYEGDGRSCADIDECQLEPDTCGPDELCTNLPGTFSCDACPDGFEVDGGACVDIDECASGDHGCHADATCTNSIGGWTCACRAGYAGDGQSCADIDECALGSDTCAASEVCVNTAGDYDCEGCPAGYEPADDACVDIDECAGDLDTCHPTLATCTDHDGGYACSCVGGYGGDGRSCADLDECALGEDDCGVDEVCENTVGGFECVTCQSGFEVVGDACEDIDECALGYCGGAPYCSNASGGYTCLCATGYEHVGTECVDVDECEVEDCDGHGTCVNEPGTYHCDCDLSYAADEGGCVAAAYQVADGIVTALAEHEGVLYVGGRFTRVQSRLGGPLVRRMGLAAFDAQTGALLDWDPYVEAPCEDISCSLSPTRLMVSEGALYGLANANFGGVARPGGFAIELTTGALLPWAPPNVGNQVRGLAAHGDSIYIGGFFQTTVSGSLRKCFLAVDKSTGALLPWNPNITDATCGQPDSGRAIGVIGDTVYLGGMFFNLSSTQRKFLAAVDATSGALVTAFAPNPAFDSTAGAQGVVSMIVHEGKVFVGTQHNSSNPEVSAFDATTGLRLWRTTLQKPATGLTSGWVSDLAIEEGRIFAVGNIQAIGGAGSHSLVALDVGTGARYTWTYGTDFGIVEGNQAYALALASAGGSVFVGGSFTKIDVTSGGGFGDAAIVKRLGALDALDGQLVW